MSALQPRLFGQDGVSLSGAHDLHQQVQRATIHAEGDCGLFCVALQLRVHRQRRHVSSVLVHKPAQLDEGPVCVGVLKLRAVELLKHLAGFLLLRRLPRSPSGGWDARRVPLCRATRAPSRGP